MVAAPKTKGGPNIMKIKKAKAIMFMNWLGQKTYRYCQESKDPKFCTGQTHVGIFPLNVADHFMIGIFNYVLYFD